MNPYTLDINRDGTLAVVGNMGGGGNGEIGSVALIDLTPGLFRTVHILAVPSSPEGVKFSPDGKFVASASVDGSTRPADFRHLPQRGPALDAGGYRQETEAAGRSADWPLVARDCLFADGTTVLVESMIDHGLNMFRWQDGKLAPVPYVSTLPGGAAAIRTVLAMKAQ